MWVWQHEVLEGQKGIALTALCYHNRTVVAQNKSSSLLNINFTIHKHYNYLQLILIQKLFTKVIKNASWVGLG